MVATSLEFRPVGTLISRHSAHIAPRYRHTSGPFGERIAPPTTPNITATNAPLARNAKVLVVDDDAGIRELLREVLLDSGYDVELAANGADALAAVRAAPPTVVLMDLMMPILSGFEATSALKLDETTAGIPIVVMSAGRTLESLGSTLPADDYVSKPFDLTRLLAILERHITPMEPR